MVVSSPMPLFEYMGISMDYLDARDSWTIRALPSGTGDHGILSLESSDHFVSMCITNINLKR